MIKFYPGRQLPYICAVWEGGSTNVDTNTSARHFRSSKITDHLPKGDGADTLLEMMKKT